MAKTPRMPPSQGPQLQQAAPSEPKPAAPEKAPAPARPDPAAPPQTTTDQPWRHLHPARVWPD